MAIGMEAPAGGGLDGNLPFSDISVLIFGYSLDDEWTPYFRFDIRDMDQGDPYYSPVNRDLDVWET